MQLTDQVAIITGSARGIGRATALSLAREGASIVVVDINATGAQEVAAEGIRVNGVRAGYIYTDMHASGGEPNRVDRVKQFVPMKRGGTTDEVAHAILWLLSSEASFTTGAFIDVTGGR